MVHYPDVIKGGRLSKLKIFRSTKNQKNSVDCLQHVDSNFCSLTLWTRIQNGGLKRY